MKRLFSLALLIVVALGIVACNALPTRQQQFLTACAMVNNDLDILGLSALLNSKQQDFINKQVLPANKAICASGGQLDVTNLKAFHDSLLPGAIDIVKAIPSLPDQPLILLALGTFGPMVQQAVDQIITAAAPAPASGSLSAAPIK